MLVGFLEVDVPSGPGVSGITVLNGVSFTESLPFMGELHLEPMWF